LRLSVQPVPVADRIDGGTVAVIIDVLRATSTLTAALANGAGRIIPVGSPEEALAMRAVEPGALACGERGGRIVQGFDLGNSPAEYTPERIGGRTLIFASTNGSLAMLAARRARQRWLAAFVNASAVADAVQGAPHVTLVCAGKFGRPALEDLACAGWLCAILRGRQATLDDAGARLAHAIAPADARAATGLVLGCPHAREVAALGPAGQRDLEFCSGVDAFEHAFSV
jgi:2-phosphosulfolactate phosphatase